MSKKVHPKDQGKMIEYRMRVTLKDGRQLSGQMLAFDKHMNLVLDDTEEFRITRKHGKAGPGGETTTIENEQKRVLGLIILRGAQVVSCSMEGPPPDDPAKRLGNSAPTISAGPGISKPAGRGVPIGLGGPAAGVGGPSPYGFPPVAQAVSQVVSLAAPLEDSLLVEVLPQPHQWVSRAHPDRDRDEDTLLLALEDDWIGEVYEKGSKLPTSAIFLTSGISDLRWIETTRQ
ncbi:Sm-like ribonucleoprotein [Penicillium taxi]|uniref:Sm-like ribonucleoprotein n=1 Tax=Penicillium taxi TaxID=168475 RepID=UPI002544E563|nr:Sm-like ribonucleoprotein [Penicillium taxi]KAJ5895249.1 Sm-like ribonucleoprotein [Penicillium taxi]